VTIFFKAEIVGSWFLFIAWYAIRWSERQRIRRFLRESHVEGRKNLARRISTPGGEA